AAEHLDVEARGQRVDHGGAHAVEAARGRVRATAELAAGVQLGEDHLDAGQAGARLDVHRDAAAVVLDLHGSPGVQGDGDRLAVTGQGLVHGVVDDLPQAVHQAPRVGRADVHPGPLPHGLQALQYGQVPCVVLTAAGHGLPSRSMNAFQTIGPARGTGS